MLRSFEDPKMLSALEEIIYCLFLRHHPSIIADSRYKNLPHISSYGHGSDSTNRPIWVSNYWAIFKINIPRMQKTIHLLLRHSLRKHLPYWSPARSNLRCHPRKIAQ